MKYRYFVNFSFSNYMPIIRLNFSVNDGERISFIWRRVICQLVWDEMKKWKKNKQKTIGKSYTARGTECTESSENIHKLLALCLFFLMLSTGFSHIVHIWLVTYSIHNWHFKVRIRTAHKSTLRSREKNTEQNKNAHTNTHT